MILINRFTDYCKKNAIHLLPDDIKFIKEVIINMPLNERRATLKRYYDEWIGNATLFNEDGLNQNYGRFKANEWLRNEAKKWLG